MKLNRRHIISGLVALAAAGASGVVLFSVIAYEPELQPVRRPSPSSFDAAEVRRGEQLASIGDCIVCHTASGSRPFAGARALPTPFGTLYSTNITPDEDTGIGRWSFAAFRRAMKDGVARDGQHLYPALPYEHFTHVTDADLTAIYAFLMTRQPVHSVQPPNDLLPGLGFRPLLAGWKLLFLDRETSAPVTNRSADWNRGKYLVEGLGHCGGCHTPRNMLGGEKHAEDLRGGLAEGWTAPALDASNPSAGRWNSDALHDYLKTGMAKGHSAAGGPMGPVAEGLSRVDDADVRAIAAYVGSRMNSEPEPRPSGDRGAENTMPEGSPTENALFDGACGGCHQAGAPMTRAGRPLLSQTTDVLADDPRNAIQAVLQGIQPFAEPGAAMPGFADMLTDKQIAEVLAHLRLQARAPAWEGLADQVGVIRKENAE